MNRTLFLLFVLFFRLNTSNAQDFKDFNHNLLFKVLKNSEGDKYKEIIGKYNKYLSIHPNDIKVLLEKARFVSIAQYNELEEYNPNQEYLDSLNTTLYSQFPNEPLIIEYKIGNLWGNDKKEYLLELIKRFTDNNSLFGKSIVGLIYFEAANISYEENKFKVASNQIQKAIFNDPKYEYCLLNAKIWIELNQNDFALKVLNDKRDTIQNVSFLNEKAKLFLIVKSFKKAIELYDKINIKDPSFINNQDLATALEGAQLYKSARKYLIKDTTEGWQKPKAYLNLFLHDLNYEEGKLGISSYNSLRDLGFKQDFFAIYRIKLFLKYPLAIWNFRDLFGILSLFAFIGILLFIPSIFILPIYVLWQRKFSVGEIISLKFNWGLKSIWLVTFAYLFLYFFSSISETDAFYANFDFGENLFVLTDEINASSQMVFMIFMAIIVASFLTQVKGNIISLHSKTILSMVLMVFGYFISFKIASGSYIFFGKKAFDINSSDLASFNLIFNAIDEQVKSLILVYGIWVTLLMVSLIVPIYEELMFRGIILNGFSRYIGFKKSNILQAALFGLLHQELFLFPIYMLFGWLCGQMTRKNESLLANIIFHIINNLIATLAIFRMI